MCLGYFLKQFYFLDHYSVFLLVNHILTKLEILGHQPEAFKTNSALKPRCISLFTSYYHFSKFRSNFIFTLWAIYNSNNPSF